MMIGDGHFDIPNSLFSIRRPVLLLNRISYKSDYSFFLVKRKNNRTGSQR